MVLQCGKDLKRLSWLNSLRTEKEETTLEHRYYISSAENRAESFLNASREHWGIETSLHWRLDIAFRIENQEYVKVTVQKTLPF